MGVCGNVCCVAVMVDDSGFLVLCVKVCCYSSFKSLRAGSQVFSLLMLFLCVILHTMSLGKSLQLLCPLVCCACLPSV